MASAVSGRYIPKPNEVTTRNQVCQGAAILVGLAGIALFVYTFKSPSRSLNSRAVMFLGGVVAGAAFAAWQKLIRHICTDHEYKGALQRNVQRGDKTAVGWILFLGANPNNPGSDGLTPLHVAKDPSIVQQLISYDADVNALSNSKDTPLHCAFNLPENAQIEVLKTLIRNGADPNAINVNGTSPLAKANASKDFAIPGSQLRKDWEEIVALMSPKKG